ncbi:hypothetical protein L484_012531 [Morus notabilis]|uniref:Uncharacterized protein n=1 Tax=Morus notabilis TaxID=981085 RepID=W9QM02_9ROSA|nr:hypothetical protein L484_012531 [Morus notabilis]
MNHDRTLIPWAAVDLPPATLERHRHRISGSAAGFRLDQIKPKLGGRFVGDSLQGGEGIPLPHNGVSAASNGCNITKRGIFANVLKYEG